MDDHERRQPRAPQPGEQFVVDALGSTIGNREWTRSRRRWGISASCRATSARRLSGVVKGSPPLRMTSSIVGRRRFAAKRPATPPRKAPECKENAAGSRNGNGRRTPHLLRSRPCLYTFPEAPAAEDSCLVQRIGDELRPQRSGQFLLARQDLQQQGIGGIAAAHPGQIRLGDEHSEPGR